MFGGREPLRQTLTTIGQEETKTSRIPLQLLVLGVCSSVVGAHGARACRLSLLFSPARCRHQLLLPIDNILNADCVVGFGCSCMPAA